MKVVGLTGGIGSGKSTVAKLFTTLGIPVYDSDTRAKQLYSESKVLKEQMQAHFGTDIYVGNQVNKIKLANIVFQDKSELAFLNQIVHPVLANDFELWKASKKTAYVVKEAAILIESGSYKNCDSIILVTAPVEVRISRVMNRDKVEKQQVEDRIKNQISDKEKEAYANFIIQNDGETSLIQQVLAFHSSFTR